MNIHGAHSYWKQCALGTAGVRRVWAGAGPQRAAYRGGAYRAASRTACYCVFTRSDRRTDRSVWLVCPTGRSDDRIV